MRTIHRSPQRRMFRWTCLLVLVIAMGVSILLNSPIGFTICLGLLLVVIGTIFYLDMP